MFFILILPFISSICSVKAQNCTILQLSNGQCEKNCPENCFSCSGNNTCRRCFPGFRLTEENLCVRCLDSHCHKCEASALTCTECISGYFWNKSTCLNCTIPGCESCFNETLCSTCNPGYLKTSNGSCVACYYKNCSVCGDDLISCTKCKPGYYGTPQCKPCKSNCTECTVDTDCFACAKGFYLAQNECKPCTVPNCLKCNGDVCTMCTYSCTYTSAQIQNTFLALFAFLLGIIYLF